MDGFGDPRPGARDLFVVKAGAVVAGADAPGDLVDFVDFVVEDHADGGDDEWDVGVGRRQGNVVVEQEVRQAPLGRLADSAGLIDVIVEEAERGLRDIQVDLRPVLVVVDCGPVLELQVQEIDVEGVDLRVGRGLPENPGAKAAEDAAFDNEVRGEPAGGDEQQQAVDIAAPAEGLPDGRGAHELVEFGDGAVDTAFVPLQPGVLECGVDDLCLPGDPERSQGALYLEI